MNMKTVTLSIVIANLICVVPAFARQTVTAVRGDVKMDVNIPGVFIADDKDEIKMEPQEYSGDLIVTRIVAEGVTVQQGDVLIEFDTAKVDEAIEEAQNEATDTAVELKKANAEHQSAVIDRDAQLVQLQIELEMLQQELAAAQSKQELDIDEKRKGMEDSHDNLKHLNEDLKMLQDIYNERNLETSTSGDILLARQKMSIENALKGIEFRKRQLEYFERFDLDKERLEKQLEIDKKKAELEKQKIMLAAEVAEKQSVVTKAQRKMDAADKKVRELQEDRSQLSVVSPREGVVFYGETNKDVPAGIIIGGSGMRNVRDHLRIGGRIKTHEILMTIATMKHLSINMNVLENDIQHLKTDLPITVYPDAFPKESFSGKLTNVDQIATKVSFYSNADRRFKVMGKTTELAPLLRSGMNCRVTIHAAGATDVIQIPVTAVFADDGEYFCYVQKEDAIEKRKIEMGLSNPDVVQISKGLQEGEVVYLSRPEGGE